MSGPSIVAGFDYATTEILLVEDRYDDARLRLGLSSGFGNPATFQRQNPDGTLPGLATSSIPDPLCGSELIGGGAPSRRDQYHRHAGMPALQCVGPRIATGGQAHHRTLGAHARIQRHDHRAGRSRVRSHALRHPIRVRHAGRNRDPMPFVPTFNPGAIATARDVSDVPASEQWQHRRRRLPLPRAREEPRRWRSAAEHSHLRARHVPHRGAARRQIRQLPVGVGRPCSATRGTTRRSRATDTIVTRLSNLSRATAARAARFTPGHTIRAAFARGVWRLPVLESVRECVLVLARRPDLQRSGAHRLAYGRPHHSGLGRAQDLRLHRDRRPLGNVGRRDRPRGRCASTRAGLQPGMGTISPRASATGRSTARSRWPISAAPARPTPCSRSS